MMMSRTRIARQSNKTKQKLTLVILSTEVKTFLHNGHEFSLLDHCSMHVKQKQCN